MKNPLLAGLSTAVQDYLLFTDGTSRAFRPDAVENSVAFHLEDYTETENTRMACTTSSLMTAELEASDYVLGVLQRLEPICKRLPLGLPIAQRFLLRMQGGVPDPTFSAQFQGGYVLVHRIALHPGLRGDMFIATLVHQNDPGRILLSVEAKQVRAFLPCGCPYPACQCFQSLGVLSWSQPKRVVTRPWEAFRRYMEDFPQLQRRMVVIMEDRLLDIHPSVSSVKDKLIDFSAIRDNYEVENLKFELVRGFMQKVYAPYADEGLRKRAAVALVGEEEMPCKMTEIEAAEEAGDLDTDMLVGVDSTYTALAIMSSILEKGSAAPDTESGSFFDSHHSSLCQRPRVSTSPASTTTAATVEPGTATFHTLALPPSSDATPGDKKPTPRTPTDDSGERSWSVTTGPVRPRCPHCGASFKRRYEMERHVKSIHMKEKRHTCTICKKQFFQSSHLKVHKDAVHAQIRTDVCTICGRSFSTKYKVDRHVRSVHLRERGYRCQLCGSEYYQGSDLKRHMKHQHAGMSTAQETVSS